MSLGERLKEERERLKLTIPAFAEIAGAKKNTVIDWQKDLSSPPASKLALLLDAGVDVLYVLTGTRSLSGGVKEDAFILSVTQQQEPEGHGPLHDLLGKTMLLKAAHYQKRRPRLEPIIQRLANCRDEDFDLIEALIARIFSSGKVI